MPGEIVLILANGVWGSASRLTEALDRVDHVVATDGAWAKAVDAGIPVDRVVGDLDSLTPTEQAALLASQTEAEIHDPDKDFTDLELAVDGALARGARGLVIFGAFGGRIDHTLANVLMLEKALDHGAAVEFIAGDETAWLVRGEFALPNGRPGDRISLIPLTRGAVIRTEGLRYHLNDEPLVRASAHGISNAIETPPVSIAVRSGTLLVVHGPAEEMPR
jgi:thiamine pyrophosphokinase